MLEEHLQKTIIMIQAHPTIGVGILVVTAALFYFRPRDMAKLVAFCVLMVGVFYVLNLLLETVGSGNQKKDQMIYKSRDVTKE